MPPGTGEEVRGLLKLGPSIAVVVTAPQLISESAVRKVVEMASEYWLPLLGFVENQQNGVTGGAGHRLSTDYGLPLLVQIPWSPEIPMSMDVHEPFDHQDFLPVTEALINRLFPASGMEGPPTSEKDDLLRRAEAWVSGEQWEAPAVPTPAPGVFVGPSDVPDIGPDMGPDIGPDMGPDMGADIVGEPWTDYHDLDDDCWETLKPFLPFFRV